MPFVAFLDDSARVDLTQVDDGVWAAIYRVSPRRRLTCRECGWRMKAKKRGGTRFFAHDPHAPACEAATESPEHLRLKALFAQAARAAGWEVSVEERVGEHRWADVLARDPESDEQVAFEVQLATQTATDAQQRAGDYIAEGVKVIWVVKSMAALGRWKTGAHLMLGLADEVVGPAARWRTVEHVEIIDDEDVILLRPVWERSERQPTIDAMVRAVLDGRAVWNADASTWVALDELAGFERDRERFDAALATALQRQAQFEAQIRKAREQRDWQATSAQRQRERNTERWSQRQQQLTKQVAELLEASGRGTCTTFDGNDARAAYAGEVFIPPWMPMTLLYVCPVIGRVEGDAAVAAKLAESRAVIVASQRDADRLHQCGVASAVTLEQFRTTHGEQPHA